MQYNFYTRYSGEKKTFFNEEPKKFLWIVDPDEILSYNCTPEVEQQRLLLHQPHDMTVVLQRLRHFRKSVIHCKISPFRMFAIKVKKTKEYCCFKDIEERIESRFVVINATTMQKMTNDSRATKDVPLTTLLEQLVDKIQGGKQGMTTPYEAVMRILGASLNQPKELYRREIILESVIRTRELLKTVLNHPSMDYSKRESFLQMMDRVVSNTSLSDLLPVIDFDLITVSEAVLISFDGSKPVTNSYELKERIEDVLCAKGL